MMKRMLCVALVLVLLAGVLPFGVFAASPSDDTNTITYDDGSYLVISLDVSPARAGNAGNTVSGNKTYTFYNSDGVTEWQAKLTASYVFTGGSYTCTSANCNITVYDTNRWHVISKTTNYAGNRATANFTMGKRVLGVTTDKPQYTVNLYCDVNGNLS